MKKNKNPLFKYVAMNWWRYIIGMITLLVSVGLDIWAPMITMSIVDDVIIGGNMDLLWDNLLCILIIGFGRAMSQYVKEFTFDIVGANIGSMTRKNLFNHMQTLSRSYFDRNNTGELMARVTDDVNKVWDMFGFIGMLIIEATIYTIGTIVVMLKINWQLSLIPLLALPVLGFLAIRLEKKLDKVYDEISEQNAVLNTVVQENFAGVRTVKSFAREEYELEKFRKNNDEYSRLNVNQAIVMANTEPLITFIPKIMQMGVLLVGGINVINGNISLGLLTMFIQYSSNIVWPMENIGWMVNSLAAGIASNKKINRILAEKPEINNDANPVVIDNPKGNLRFENVCFDMHDSRILENISFDLPKGKTLGIMGVTGSGKSTIVNLIGRFYDVTDGSITIDGVNVKQLPLEFVRNNSSVVTQDVFLFSDTIKENVRLGSRDTMTDDRVKAALKSSHSTEFVDKLSEGADTVIGERGVGLSGGQKQRISIARALAKKANILIMDDSTSALDMETEFEIQKELSSHNDISKIIIAHRISSVRNADEIIILDGGKIAERGTHEELLNAKGLYYSTYEAQYGDYRKALSVLGEEAIRCR